MSEYGKEPWVVEYHSFSELSDEKAKLSSIFSQCLEENLDYAEALETVRKNSMGRIWLISGAVFRTLLQKLYGHDSKIPDWDFMTEGITDQICVADGWEVGKNKFNNPRLKKEAVVIDLMPLGNFERFKIRGLEATIENYLLTAPLTIQAIAYDTESETLLGEMGIKSITERTVAVNDEREFFYFAKRKGFERTQLLLKVAEEFGLQVIL